MGLRKKWFLYTKFISMYIVTRYKQQSYEEKVGDWWYHIKNYEIFSLSGTCNIIKRRHYKCQHQIMRQSKRKGDSQQM